MTTAHDDQNRLNEIIDHHDIRNLLSTYCHGCDRGDGAMMASVYAAESRDDHGLYKGTGLGFTESVMQQFLMGGARCTHLLGQSLIKLFGDSAGAETNFLAAIFRNAANEGETVTLLSGRYVDTLVRESEGWKITNRVVVRDWSRRLESSVDPLLYDNFVMGQLSQQDLSYSVLGLEHSGLEAWLASRSGNGQNGDLR